MAAADIAVQSSNYHGVAALGGGSLGVAKIETRPIENLAHYTVMFNKDAWEENNKVVEAKIKELADYTALDYNNAIPKEKPIALQAYTTIQEKSKEYARKRGTGTERVQQDLQFKQDIAEALSTIKNINARSISYQAQKKGIANNTALTAEQKDERYKQLDRLAESSDHTTGLASLEQFDLTVPEVAAPVQKKVSVGHYDGNKWVTEGFTFFDPKNIDAAYLEVNGMTTIDENSPEWASLSQTQKDQQLLLKKSKSQARVWNDASKFYTEALHDPKYKTEGGKIDYEAIKSSNPLISGVLGLVDNWNEYATRMKTAIQTGYYTDQAGKQMKLSTGLNADDYFTIDKEKGVTPAQMVFLQKFAKAEPDGRSIDMKYTGEQTSLSLEAMGNASAEKMNREDNANARELARMRTDTPTTEEGGEQFGNLIDGINVPSLNIGDKKGSIRNGTLVDDKGNVMNVNANGKVAIKYLDNAMITEYNKYVGQAKLNAEGNPTTDPVPSKIDVSSGNYVNVKFVGGEIEGIQASDGSYITRQQMQHITRQSGQKGATKVRKPDTDYGKYDKKGQKVDEYGVPVK